MGVCGAEYLETSRDLQAKQNYVVNLKTILLSAYLRLSTEEGREWKDPDRRAQTELIPGNLFIRFQHSRETAWRGGGGLLVVVVGGLR